MLWHIMFFAKILLLLLVCHCAGDQSENINDFLFGTQNFEFVDLTQSNDKSETNVFDNPRNPSQSCLNTESGTNINFIYYDYVSYEKYGSNRDISLTHLILPLIIADISDKVNGNANFELQKHHLDYFLNNYFSNTNQPCLMVFKFGWSQYFNDKQKYCGINGENSTTVFPGVSEDVAKWITLAYKNIVGVGVDLPGLDPGTLVTLPAFKTLINAGVYVLTNIQLDKYIPETSCTALVMPPKVKGAGSLLTRLVAVCPKSRMQNPQTRSLARHL